MKVRINPACWQIGQVEIDKKTTLKLGQTADVSASRWDKIKHLEHHGKPLLEIVKPDKGDTN